jgi:hypothetical protein
MIRRGQIMRALLVIMAAALACSVAANNASFADKLREPVWYYIAPDKLHDYGRPCPQIGFEYMYWDSPHVVLGPPIRGDIILCGPTESCGS